MSFSANWLEIRYPFDAAARCKILESRVIHYFSGIDYLRVLDVGAGLGANIRYYAQVLPGNQEWILVDDNRKMNKNCLSHLRQWAVAKNWPCQNIAGGIEINFTDRKVFVRTLCESLLNLASFIKAHTIDLAMANAVFDLFSDEQFVKFICPLAMKEIPFLGTLNYRSMSFSPRDPRDSMYIDRYQQHMVREQHFGRAMGPYCVNKMVDHLKRSGYKTCTGKSPWVITSRDSDMLNHMLSFMQSAISQLSYQLNPVHLKQWIAAKRQAIDCESLVLTVDHIDIFGYFGERE